MRRVDELTERAIIEMYRNYDKLSYICAMLNVGRSTVMNVLRRNGIPRRKRPTYRQFRQRATALRGEGCKVKEIARRLGVSVRTVYSLLHHDGADGGKMLTNNT